MSITTEKKKQKWLGERPVPFVDSTRVSRHDLDCSELVEVVIEGKRNLDAESFHDDFAGAVCEAPIFIGELLKCLPRKG